MISVQSVIDRMEFILDAEDSDRYTFENDFKPAINSSVEWLQAVFNKVFSDKKLSEEDLEELIKVAIFQTSQFSRFNMEQMDDPVWSVLKINPEPVLYPENPDITVQSNPFDSLWRPDLMFVKSKYSAKLLSTEQWEDNVDNIFEAGNEKLLNSFKSYAYLNFTNYSSTTSNIGAPEIEIRPEVKNGFISVTYLKYPTPINSVTDNIEFPESLINLVYNKALNFISWKQGDNTNLYSVSDKDVMTLVKLMV